MTLNQRLHALAVLAFFHLAFGGFVEIPTVPIGGPYGGLLAAFSDINQDKAIDILLVTNSSVVALLGSSSSTGLSRHELLQVDTDSVVGLVPADFDGDLQNDLLVVTAAKGNGARCRIYYQNPPLTFSVHYEFAEIFIDEPLVIDYNGDMRPDILVELEPGRRAVYISSKDRNFTKVLLSIDVAPPFLHPQLNSFVDWDGDRAADMVLLTQSFIEVWSNQQGNFTPKHVLYPSDTSLRQTVMTDFDADGYIEMVAIASSNNTDTILIWRSDTETFAFVTIDLSYNGSSWRFSGSDGHPPRLVMGDYNNDGYPDAVAILKNTVTGIQYAFPLDNVPCNGAPRCSSSSRTFSVSWKSGLVEAPGIIAAAFYDSRQNGILDILLTGVEADGSMVLRIFENDVASYSCFVKVMVVSGLCEDSCLTQKPFTNQPGPSVYYSSTHADGRAASAVGGQLYQTAHFALLLPFVMFGLGETPNFIDQLTVGIPPSNGQTEWKKAWTMVIPNANLVVVPQPSTNPSKWQQKLYVKPGRLVLITGSVLLSSCFLAASIIGLLHWKEKRDDEAEKRQQSQRFHFNAM